MSRPVRPSAKAVVVEKDRVLLLHLRHDVAGDFYELPGGGIRPGEDIRAAARREVREESGYPIDVHELLWVRDFIAANHATAYLHAPGHHGVEFMFRASLIGPAAEPLEVDNYQIGVEWIGADRLSELHLSPRILAQHLAPILADRTLTGPTYWGDVS